MAKVIERVVAVVNYVDGRTDDGYFTYPIQPGGQYQSQFATLWKEDGVEIFINLSHVINIDQKIIFRDGEDNHGIKVVNA